MPDEVSTLSGISVNCGYFHRRKMARFQEIVVRKADEVEVARSVQFQFRCGQVPCKVPKGPVVVTSYLTGLERISAYYSGLLPESSGQKPRSVCW